MKWILTFLAPLYCFASIKPIHSIREVEHAMHEGSNVLVVFDIDDTLTILTEPAFQSPNFKVHHSAAFSSLMNSLNEELKFLAFSLPLIVSPSHLIEPHTPSIIESLQNKGARTIALTAAPAGDIGGVLLEDSRISELRRVGINFASSFPQVSEIFFTNFEAPSGGYTLYKEGVLFANVIDKGAVLVEFLKSIDWQPDLIVFIDDRIDHVIAVEKALAAFRPETPYKGLHFQMDHGRYTTTDSENFRAKWDEMVEIGKKIASKGN